MDNKSIICITLSGLLVSGTTNASSNYSNNLDSNNLQESNRDKLSIINPQLQPQNGMEQSNISYNENGTVPNPMFQDETNDTFDRYQIKHKRANSDFSQEDIARSEVVAHMMHQSASDQGVNAEIMQAQINSLNRENQEDAQNPNNLPQTQMPQNSNELREEQEASQIQDEPVQMQEMQDQTQRQEIFDQNDLTGEEIIQQEFQQDNRTRREKVHDFFYRGVVFFGHLEGSMKNSVAKLVMSILKNICKAFVTALRVNVPEVDQELGGNNAQNQQTRPNTPAVIPGRRTPAIASGRQTPYVASRAQSPAPTSTSISRAQTPRLRANSPAPTSTPQSPRSRSRSASPARTSTSGRKLIRQSPSPYSSLRQSRSAMDTVASKQMSNETLEREIPDSLTPSDELSYSPDPEEQA